MPFCSSRSCPPESSLIWPDFDKKALSRLVLAVLGQRGWTQNLRPFRTLRDPGSYTIVKAQAHTYGGNLVDGITNALRGLELAKQYHSKRHISRVQIIYDRLYMTPPELNPA